jgi:hypothetical protein
MNDRLQRISWGAIFAGCLLALATYLVLSVLGTAIGASAIDPIGSSNPFHGFGTGTGIWLLASTLISVFVGALVAGRSAPAQGGLHGLLSWAATTLIATYMLASLAGGVAGATFGMVGKGLSLAGEGVAAATPDVVNGVKHQLRENGIELDWGHLQGELDTVLRQTGKPQLDPSTLKSQAQAAGNDAQQTAQQAAVKPQQAGDELAQWFDRVREEGQPVLNAADKDALLNVIVARTGKSRDEAQQIVDNYAQTYQQAMQKFEQLKQQADQKAREAGDAAARGVSKAAWATLLLLILGGVLSFVTGTLAWREPVRVVVNTDD